MRMLAHIREIEQGIFEARYVLGRDVPVTIIVENAMKFFQQGRCRGVG